MKEVPHLNVRHIKKSSNYKLDKETKDKLHKAMLRGGYQSATEALHLAIDDFYNKIMFLTQNKSGL